MNIENVIYGVLHPGQLQAFCKKFSIKPKELLVNFTGWRKTAIMTDAYAFLFPRSHYDVVAMEKEYHMYQLFSEMDLEGLPHVVEYVKDKTIYPYPFMQLNKLQGYPVTMYLEKMTLEQRIQFFTTLGKTVAGRHTIDITQHDVSFLEQEQYDPNEPIRIENCAIYMLMKQSSTKACDVFFDAYKQYAKKYSVPEMQQNTIDKYRSWISQLTQMSPVILHGDLHEDQILVDSHAPSSITAVLDRDAACIGHPLKDFDFTSWGIALRDYYKDFSEYRKYMRTAYLQERNLDIPVATLDLYYTIHEFIMLLTHYKETPENPLTHSDFPTAVRRYLHKIRSLGG